MSQLHGHITVEEYVDVIGGSVESHIVCANGGRISAITPPGCWGPMITPNILGGHEVTRPVYVEGAEFGDSIAISIEKIEVLSHVCSSGTCMPIKENFDRDPSVQAICPHCHTVHPKTYLEGIGENAIRCSGCGQPIIPQIYENGYTVAYSAPDNIAVAVPLEGAVEIAHQTNRGEVFLPHGSRQYLATILGRADFDGLPIRCRPMIGNIGCVPAIPIPSSKNTGDFAASLEKTSLFTVPSREQLTDAHMDINLVGEGSVVISPVLVQGGGVYFGDVHLTQGCGEVAGHTLDVCAKIVVRVQVMKGLQLAGPIILPTINDLDSRFRPFTQDEYSKAEVLYQKFFGSTLPHSYPIQVVGTGKGMDDAFQNALHRTVQLTGLPAGEVMNRLTVGGEICIGRTSGCVYLTILLESKTLEHTGLLSLVEAQYQ